MSDVMLAWNATTQTADLVLVNGQLAIDNTLQTAVIISWFTDRRADDDDVLPDYVGPHMRGTGNRRGCWSDHYPLGALASIAAGFPLSPTALDRWGSLFWLLFREKSTADVVARAKQYGEDALQWMIDNNVAASVDVTAEVLEGDAGDAIDTLRVGCRIVKPDNTTEEHAFDYAWRAQAGAAGVALPTPNPSALDNFILDQSALA